MITPKRYLTVSYYEWPADKSSEEVSDVVDSLNGPYDPFYEETYCVDSTSAVHPNLKTGDVLQIWFGDNMFKDQFNDDFNDRWEELRKMSNYFIVRAVAHRVNASPTHYTTCVSYFVEQIDKEDYDKHLNAMNSLE